MNACNKIYRFLILGLCLSAEKPRGVSTCDKLLGSIKVYVTNNGPSSQSIHTMSRPVSATALVSLNTFLFQKSSKNAFVLSSSHFFKSENCRSLLVRVFSHNQISMNMIFFLILIPKHNRKHRYVCV